ncbi:transmembrane protein 132C-like isoform X2 [Takifugu rubripes]|nr:transmembrane protein 132C-like isoform X2 [Takifugu rubripes]XP_029693699.1 transmembrane protein 132C-like isoform X2 [Takifugu rubripes]XP_029693700.1 transmembrane protein 132C-like isoform X2 [Takifugu rubripes]
MRNASLQARTESFFIHQARQVPVITVSYGPWSVQQSLPPDLLRVPMGPLSLPSITSLSSSPPTPAAPLFTFNWKIHAYIIRDKIHPSWPKVQVLFYMTGRNWDDYRTTDKLPCVSMFAFHETQEVRGTCKLKGELGLCVAELEPLASWFSPPTVRPGRRRVSEQGQGTPVELYYMVQPTDREDCSSEASRKPLSTHMHQQGRTGASTGHTQMRHIGSIRLLQPLMELKLDDHFVVIVPSKPVRQRETVSVFLAASLGLPVQIFSLRLKMKDGAVFLGARASDPVLWTVSQDIRSEGHRVVTLHCHRNDNRFIQRTEAAVYQQVLQVDLEMNVLLGLQWSQEVTWQVEYPLTRTVTPEVTTLIQLAQQDLGGIVPLAMETELLNTAVLTGRTVAVPVKVLTVASDGAVSDVTESAECRSADEQVIKVSERCDYVYVNGKETRGQSRALLNFTYSFLSAQLQMSVWSPRLPLLIHVSDPELNQIKGWRVPVRSRPHSDERRSHEEGGCVAQYQSSALRVLTYFVADAADVKGMPEGEGPSRHNFLLGSDWQVEVTQMVKDSLRVADPHVAQVLDGHVLMGARAGTTSIQVVSPLTSAVLAETTIRVLDDKVSVTELGVQLVSGLSLSLQPSRGSNRAIVATATTQEVIESLNQESLISAWLQFSDGSMTPLDNYDPAHFTLTATSLEERVVQVRRSAQWKWPTVIAKGEGQGLLVRVEIRPSEACQPEELRGVLAVGMANIQVRLSEPEQQSRQTGDWKKHPDPPYFSGSVSEPDTGSLKRLATTIKEKIKVIPNGKPLSADSEAGGFSKYPNMGEIPRGRSIEEDMLASRGGLTDLEIGMYALLGVFCLAILVFLINCVSYAYKHRSKQLTLENPGMMSHAHDWVWLGQEGQLCLQQQQDDLAGTLEEGCQLLNGAVTRANNGSSGKIESLNSPTTRRKRVKFTTFSKAKSCNGSPVLSPLALVQTSDIKWACSDMELGDSKQPRK